MKWLKELFTIHEWYVGDYSLNVRSKYTGDLIGRIERHCLNCPLKQLSISNLSVESKDEIIKILGKRDWYTYVEGDWLDSFTRRKLTVGSIAVEIDSGIIDIPHVDHIDDELDQEYVELSDLKRNHNFI